MQPVLMHPSDAPMNDKDITLEIVKNAINGCRCCGLEDECFGEHFEPCSTLSGHPSCLAFDYNHGSPQNNDAKLAVAMGRPLRVEYVNWRGETGIRTILPKRRWFGSTEFHTEDQWLLDVFDLERSVERTFAVEDICGWELIPE